MASITGGSSLSHILEDELSKIRPHVNSKLPHQKAPAQLLIALESTLTAQDSTLTPVAYFAALVTTLEQSIRREEDNLNLDEGAVTPAILYLLALVLPSIPTVVIRSHLPTALPILAPLFPKLLNHAPPLRSQLSIFAVIIPGLDTLQLSTPNLRQSFASILELTVDPRPKVRKKAQEVIYAVLSSPPPPTVKHPYADQVANFILGVLNAVDGTSSRGKNSKPTDTIEVGIWCCAFLKTIATFWPSAHLEDLITILLRLPRLSSPYLTSTVLNLLSNLLLTPSLVSSATSAHLPTILSTLLSSVPSAASAAVQPWLEAVENTMVAYAREDPQACSQKLLEVWNTSWAWLKAEDTGARVAAGKALSAMARYCVSEPMCQDAILNANGATQKKAPLTTIVRQLNEALTALPFAQAIPQTLSVLAALISRLRFRSAVTAPGTRAPAVAEILLSDLVATVGELRAAPAFEFREKADEVLGKAIEVMGPERFLEILPLNIIPTTEKREGRAFLLPLLASHVTNTRLSHFTSYFVPLSEQLFNLQTKAADEDKKVEAKIWEACVEQIWACFKGYCDLTVDLRDAFTITVARLLTQLLYTQPALRTPVLVGLRTLVRSNTNLSKSSAPASELLKSFGIDQAEASKNLDFLSGLAGNLLAVLFNVFGSIESEGRGLVGEVIGEWLGVAGSKELDQTFTKITTLLKQSIESPPVARSTPAGTSPVSHNMLDLLIVMIPHLSQQSAIRLLEMCTAENLMESKDSSVQKKVNRISARLIETNRVPMDDARIELVVTRLSQTTESVTAGAKRDRLQLLAALIPSVPNTQLHFIPSLLPEAILATKEVNEKARNVAFDLLVVIGKKMQKGGVIKRSLIDEMDDEMAGDVKATIEEYLTMVAGGLAGSTPHMISATITAISRIVFEFKDDISATMLSEVVATTIVFVSSANREIVKSALGFVKVAVVTLPVAIVRPHLSTLVPALLGWSHDHKNHFKVKVRHVFERMIRRFGFDDVYKEAREEEAAKVLVNIKKRKERAKKKRVAREEGGGDEEDEDDAPARPTTGDAFEDVVYGSESELGDASDDDTRPAPTSRQNKAKGNRSEARIRLDDDEPMDLLHGTASKITTLTSNRRRKPGQDASRFKTDDDTGKMVVDEEDDADDQNQAQTDVAGTAYREQITSVEGFSRGADGRVKFNKNTKKRRAAEDMEDVEMADAPPAAKSPRTKRKDAVRLGQEFKAKNAGGDVVRPGKQEPYAYLPLGQVTKKRGSKAKYVITGKK